MLFPNSSKYLAISDIILIVTVIVSILTLPLITSAAQDVFNMNSGHDAFTLPEKTTRKTVTGIGQDRYDIVVDNKTINHSLTTGNGNIDLNIEFGSGSANLTETAKRQIHQISIALKSKNLIHEKIMIIGHTDNVGSAEINRKLSEKRALQVKKALIKSGIDKIRLKSSGRGESEPIASNKTAAGRSRNRRVTLAKITDQPQKTD